MTLDIRAICRPEVAPGLRLAGLPVYVAEQPEDVNALLERASGAGLVLVQDELFEPGEADVGRRGGPVLVPFPGPSWRRGDVDDHVLEILRRAIGYRVRLR